MKLNFILHTALLVLYISFISDERVLVAILLQFYNSYVLLLQWFPIIPAVLTWCDSFLYVCATGHNFIWNISGLDRLRWESQRIGGNIRGHTPVHQVLMSSCDDVKEHCIQTSSVAEVALLDWWWTLKRCDKGFQGCPYTCIRLINIMVFFFFYCLNKINFSRQFLSFFGYLSDFRQDVFTPSLELSQNWKMYRMSLILGEIYVTLIKLYWVNNIQKSHL